MKHWLWIALLCTMPAAGQEIKRNEVDGFTGQRSIETSIVSLKSALVKGTGIYFSAQGQHLLVNMVGYGLGMGPVRKSDFVYFLLNDRMILTATSIADQPAYTANSRRVYQHHYLMRQKDFEDLRDKTPMLIRVTTPSGNNDIPLTKRNQKELKKLAVIFLQEVERSR